MRIALVHNAAGEGPKRAIYQLSKGLLAQGHTIQAFVPQTANEQLWPLSSLGIPIRQYVWPSAPQKPPLRPFILESYAALFRGLAQSRRSRSLYRKMARAIHAERYDIVWVDNCQVTETPFILPFLKALPTLVYCHEPKRSWYEPELRLRSTCEEGQEAAPGIHRLYTDACLASRALERWRLRRAAKSNIRHAHRVVTNSQHTQQYIQRVFGRKAQVSYLGVDTAVFRQIGIRRERIALSVGRLNAFDRHDLAIKALGLIEQRRRPGLVIVAGTSHPAKAVALERLAAEHGVSLQVCYRISDEELVQWYNRAGVVLSTKIREPFGLIPIEAMACGTPVIGVREGGLLETVQDGRTGLLVEATPEAFADAIRHILDTPHLQEQMGIDGTAAVRTAWTWDAALERFQRHMLEVATGCLG